MNQESLCICALIVGIIIHYELPQSEASYTLRLRAHRYWNSRHKDSGGDCCDKTGSSNCDPSWCVHCQCDNRFKFCLRRRGSSRNGNEDYCPLGSYWTGEIGDDSFTFGSSQITGGVPNPMTFRGDIWRGGFQLLVSIYDEDTVGSDDHVDDVYVEERIDPGETIAEREYIGVRSNAHITFSSSLSCNDNFYGSDCATFCEARDSDSGHYTCDSETGARRCRSGWSDPNNNCLTPVCADGCHVVGGYCDSPGQCSCRDGWSGTTCQQCQLASGCSEVGGYCNVPGECICGDGYSGARCEIDLIPCQRGNPCSNEALCTNDGVGGYICHCPVGYTGMECEHEINECDPNPCHNDSSCIDEVNGFTCVCPEGFKGEFCHIDTDECLSDPCHNNAACVDLPNDFVCLCPYGYVGKLCDRNRDDCTPYPCENGGTCQDLLGGYECECGAGWTGDRCHVDIDDCVSIPCQNGASCFDLVNGYVCVCESGWTGQECHLEVNECDSSPCQNGAQCTDLFNGYTCSCIAGYYGPNCEYEFNECLSGPCLHGGSCDDHVNGYMCNCTDGFSGTNCEIDLDPCRTNPCQNRGSCMGHDNGYACACAPGYTDYNCLGEISVEVEGLSSDNTDEGSPVYLVWGVPTVGVLLLILIVAMVIIALYCHRQRRKGTPPMLPPPSQPMETGKGLGKAVPNPVYSAPLPEPHVYESLDDYAAPGDLPVKIPLEKSPPEDYEVAITENPYANTE